MYMNIYNIYTYIHIYIYIYMDRGFLPLISVYSRFPRNLSISNYGYII